MVRTALVRFWWVWLIVFVDVALAAGIAVVHQPARHSVSAVVSIGPQPETGASAALIALLSTKYVAFASSDTLAEEVARDLGLPPAEVRDGLEIQMPERTTNISIEMTADDAAAAADEAGVVSERLVERAESDEYLNAQIVVPADPDRAVERSGRARLLAATTVAAAALAVAVTVMVHLAVTLRARRRARAGAPAANG